MAVTPRERASASEPSGRERMAERIEVTGVVQGVGFRPFVHRLATELGIAGRVGNDAARVFIDAAGPPTALASFVERLRRDAPPLSRVDEITRRHAVAPVGEGFTIVASRAADGPRTLVPPDTATCDDCLAEMCDPSDRRHEHPFITCTNCGPRFTIIRDLPYDRPATTMAGFAMCDACAAEYEDPSDRRYHAQPIACHDCGPTLSYQPSEASTGLDDSGTFGDVPTEGARALTATAEALRAGLTVAAKGIGGYHLLCDATNDKAVRRLRDRKHRPDKPFAVMVRDLEAARELAHIDEAEAALLTSPARPVVLLRARTGDDHDALGGAARLSPFVAPDNPLIGLLLPPSGLHHLLMAALDGSVVATSGNISGEPIAYRDDDAVRRLAPLCDGFLTHDRPIHVPCDDSVVRVVDDELLPIRRARGYAPLPVRLRGTEQRVLAVGGELKNAFCLAADGNAWMSQHLGDMGSIDTLAAFEASVEQFTTLYAVEPDIVAIDAHPGYQTGAWARRHHADSVVEVQHHHAHIAAVMAEHDLDPTTPVLGFAFDGTGYGGDGAIWGGEVLLADATEARRHAHLRAVPLPGGDAAVRHPCRVALAHLAVAGIDWDDDLPPVRQLTDVERGLLRRQLTTGFACVPTTSMGRLFDAVASLLDIRHEITYEAQAAIELEVAAVRAGLRDRGYRFSVTAPTRTAVPTAHVDSESVIDPGNVWRAMVRDLRGGVAVDVIAGGFHAAVAEMIADIVARDRRAEPDRTVVLSGGVFQNAALVALCLKRLRADGVTAFTHRTVPPNDGGLALGQAFVAAHRNTDPRPALPQSPTL